MPANNTSCLSNSDCSALLQDSTVTGLATLWQRFTPVSVALRFTPLHRMDDTINADYMHRVHNDSFRSHKG